MPKPFLKSAANFRHLLNWYPPFWFTGIEVETITEDFRYARVQLKLRWYTRNYVKTHFGGSLFAMTDPFYMLMLMNILGPNYYVWDKAASIDYIKPGRSDVYAEFRLSERDIDAIKTATAGGEKHFAEFEVTIVDSDNEPVAKVLRRVYVRKKKHVP